MKQPNQRLQRWIAFMQSGYKFDIAYRQGKKHQNADAFSRLVVSPYEPLQVRNPDGTLTPLDEVPEIGGFRPDPDVPHEEYPQEHLVSQVILTQLRCKKFSVI